jgi:hypothetical protein
MSNEGKLDKRLVTLRVAIETCRKAEAKYGQESDESWRESLIRALEDATRDYQLTPDDYRAIAAEVEANRVARQEKRNRHA